MKKGETESRNSETSEAVVGSGNDRPGGKQEPTATGTGTVGGGDGRTDRGNETDGNATGTVGGIDGVNGNLGDGGDDSERNRDTGNDNGTERGDNRNDRGNGNDGDNSSTGTETRKSRRTQKSPQRTTIPELLVNPTVPTSIPKPKPVSYSAEPEEEKRVVRRTRSKGITGEMVSQILYGLFGAYRATKPPHLRMAWEIDQSELQQAGVHIAESLDALPVKYTKQIATYIHPVMAVVCLGSVIGQCAENEKKLVQYWNENPTELRAAYANATGTGDNPNHSVTNASDTGGAKNGTGVHTDGEQSIGLPGIKSGRQ